MASPSANDPTNGLQSSEQAVVGHATMKAWTASSNGVSPSVLGGTFFLYMFSSATILVLSTTFRWWKYSALTLLSNPPVVKSAIISVYACGQVWTWLAPGSVISGAGGGSCADAGQVGAVTAFLLMLGFDL
jgi:hypothetical protein